VVCGPLGDRYGRYRTIAAAAAVSAFGSAACAIAPSLDLLVAARLVSGATIGAFIPLALAWIGDTVAYEKRQPLLARFLVGQMAGVAFGTAAAGWLAEISAGGRFSSRCRGCFFSSPFCWFLKYGPTRSPRVAARVEVR
jgi:MFS family permease